MNNEKLAIIFFVIFIVVTGTLYYSEKDKQRKKNENIMKCVAIGLFISIFCTTVMWYNTNYKSNKILLQEDFWD